MVYSLLSDIHCPAPPTVGVTPSEQLLSVGNMLILTCTGSDCVGTSTFTFFWLLDGSPVEASLVTSIDGTTSQLSVTSVTSSDFGTYTCNVMNEHGTGSAVAYVRESGEHLTSVIVSSATLPCPCLVCVTGWGGLHHTLRPAQSHILLGSWQLGTLSPLPLPSLPNLVHHS